MPRSAEIKPLFWRFVYSSLFNFTVRGGTRTRTWAIFKALTKKKKNFFFLSPEIIVRTIIFPCEQNPDFEFFFFFLVRGGVED